MLAPTIRGEVVPVIYCTGPIKNSGNIKTISAITGRAGAKTIHTNLKPNRPSGEEPVGLTQKRLFEAKKRKENHSKSGEMEISS